MAVKGSVKKAVLAYSGGLDTSVIVPWLRNNYGCEVVCFCANLGQEEELEGLEEKAIASGATRCYVEDLRAEFLTDFVFPTMQAGAIYERDYLLGTSFARPLIAKRLVEIAQLERADAVAHGATGKGNDQVRFELTVMALNPKLKIIAPWREWDIRGRSDALDYAAEHNVPVKASAERIYSQDRNLWHLSNEGGPLEDPWTEPPADMFEWTRSPEDAPDEPAYVELYFRRGLPERINGAAMGPVEVVQQLNAIGCEHGIGRVDLVENRPGGHEESRRVRDAGRHDPVQGARGAGAAVPGQGHAALEAAGRAALRRTGLQRALVHAPAQGVGRVRAGD